MGRRKIVLEHPALDSLIRAAGNIGSAADVKNVPQQALDLLQNATVNVRSAIDVIVDRDPLNRRLGMICLMIQESTAYRAEKINGQIKEVVEVTDEYMFSWALRDLHQLPVRFKL